MFNNTGAEHPETYAFVKRMKKHTEAAGLPFFICEFHACEEWRRGHWTRVPTYLLRTTNNWSTRGEPFLKMVSWKNFVPNVFNRTCTKELKIETTRRLLEDWLSGQDATPPQGHGGPVTLADPLATFQHHQRAGGKLKQADFDRRKAPLNSADPNRPSQRCADHSPPRERCENPLLSTRREPGELKLEKGGAEYVSLIGLRADEQTRVSRVHARPATEGEHIYTPLHEAGVDRAQVNASWDGHPMDLNTPPELNISNCVYCFLKPPVSMAMVRETSPGIPGIPGTPSSPDWWANLEENYGRGRPHTRRKGNLHAIVRPVRQACTAGSQTKRWKSETGPSRPPCFPATAPNNTAPRGQAKARPE